MRRRGEPVQVAAHRHALLVPGGCRLAGVGIGAHEVPAAEEAHQHARPGRRVGLLALHRVEEGLTRVLRCPDRGVSRGERLPAQDLRSCPNLANGCCMRSGLGSEPECLPKKLSSSAVASAVWLSVEPIMPNLNGFVPSFSSSCRPS